MNKVRVRDAKVGMILKNPILNNTGLIELLSAGTVLSEQNLKMLKKLGIKMIVVSDHKTDSDESEVDINLLKRKANETGETFDAKKLTEEIVEVRKLKYDEVYVSTVNQNLEISLITGDGDVAIDQRHEKIIAETKGIFDEITQTGVLNIGKIEENVEQMLPDMIRNEDVLMRINQLKETDDYTFEHSLRVSVLASMVGKWLGYSYNDLLDISQAGLLFDIGKLKIPKYILMKKDKVTEEEYKILKIHSQLGYNILLKTPGISQGVKFAALQHHERFDGSGYPLHIKGKQIHEFAKIIMICDVFDAITSERPYKNSISPIEACEYLNVNSGKIFDSKISFILIKKLSEYYLGKRVLLNTGEEGKIVHVDINYPTKPLIQSGNKFIDLSKEPKIAITKMF